MPAWFRLLGRLEGLSFLTLLFVGMPVKYYMHLPVVVKIMGPIHGLLFLAYWAGVFWLASENRWPRKQQIAAYLAAVVPFGTFIFEKKYHVAPHAESCYQEISQ